LPCQILLDKNGYSEWLQRKIVKTKLLIKADRRRQQKISPAPLTGGQRGELLTHSDWV
jgi:hypothetical protein